MVWVERQMLTHIFRREQKEQALAKKAALKKNFALIQVAAEGWNLRLG